MTLTLQNIDKAFGDHPVLSGISFRVEAGRALGLLGRNGAGKTTTLRILMGLFPADQGQVLLDDKPLSIRHTRIGYLPEERGLYPKHPIGEQLIFLAKLRGLSGAQARKATDYWLEKVQLRDARAKNLETLSKGNQQKIQLAATLLHDPDIIILDEPFSGLDPVNAELLKRIVREQVALGKLLLFSSHQMTYVEEFCDDIALLHQGSIVLNGALRDIQRAYPRDTLHIRLDTPSLEESDRLLTAFAQTLTPPCRSFRLAHGGAYVQLSTPDACGAVLSALVKSGLPVSHYEVVTPSLQDIFIEKAGEEA